MIKSPETHENWLDAFERVGAAQKLRANSTPRPRLLVRPKRAPQESRQHHLMRTAEANGLSGISDLASVLAIKPSDLLGLTDQALAQYLRGVDFAELSPPLLRPLDSTVLIRRRLWTRSRICPQCIREQIPLPLYFDFPLSLRCDLHQLLLIDRCPRCETVLSYLRTHRSHCDCGQPLRELQSATARGTVDLFNCIFAPWRLHSNWFVDEEKTLGLEVSSALTLSTILSAALHEETSSKRSQPWLRAEDWPLVENLISPWPHEIEGHLTSIAEDLTPQQSASLLQRLSAPDTPALHDLAASIRTLQTTKRRARMLLDVGPHSEPMIAVAQVRKIAKLDAEATQALFKSGYFKTVAATVDGADKQYWVSESEAQKLSENFAQTIDCGEAANILGCPPACVTGLVRIGHLRPWILPHKPRSPRFYRSDIDAHILSLRSIASGTGRESNSLVPLSNIQPSAQGKKYWFKGWQVLIQKIFAGSVPLHRLRGGRGWGAFGVSAEELQRCGLKRVEGSHVSP